MDDALRWKVDTVVPVYAREPFPDKITKTIFLAGPTPRKDGVPSWRPEALKILGELGFDGHVFVPEPRDGQWLADYDGQIEWEEEGLNRADVIVFWVPREIPDMMALTTNIEWGMWKTSGKVIWSAPPSAKNTRYAEYYAEKLGVPRTKELREALLLATIRLHEGSPREGGETQVPLHIWTRKEFQSWLVAQKGAGNRLDGARVVWSFYPKPKTSRFLFCYAMHVNVFIASENRHKHNEVILSRPDVSAVLLHTKPAGDNTRIVLVREFRSPVRNESGFLHELPGGSSVEELSNPLGVAADEVSEETGLHLDHKRFQRHETRQILSTLSIHKCALFSCELTDEEMDRLALDKEAHGNLADTERTYIEVETLGAIKSGKLVDWTNLGMILSVLEP